ncbi:NRT2 ribosyltransferase, partial [Pomatorhinus ruficollis]|nr:NRT2 ribosyltransferase [Pomatorhinus ruficollis]
MAALAHTLALLTMLMATKAIELKPLIIEQITGCRSAPSKDLPPLKRPEFQQNPLFAQVWAKATDEWQRRGPPESPLSPEQAIAIMAYMMKDMYKEFNAALRMAGHSTREHQDNFHFKMLHVLLTEALAVLRDAQKWNCKELLHQVCGVQFKAKRGDTVHFGEFTSMSLNETTGNCSGKETLLQVYTCEGADISSFSDNSQNWGVLIPPFEIFEVTKVTETGDKAVIQLHSAGTDNDGGCDDLPDDTTGGSISMAPFHLGGFLLASTALAMTTGIL